MAACEATDALASELGAGGPAQVMIPLALVSLLALPLGVAVLAHHVTQDRRVAAVAAVLSIGLIFPTWRSRPPLPSGHSSGSRSW